MFNKKQSILLVAFISVLIGIYYYTNQHYYRSDNRPGQTAQNPKNKDPHTAAQQQAQSPAATRKISSVTPSLTPQQKADYMNYFQNTLIKNNSHMSAIYDNTKRKLSSIKTGNIISVFVAQSVGINSTNEFTSFSKSLLADVVAHSQELAADIRSNDSTLKENPFIYQMTLNLVRFLAIPQNEKAELLGKALEIPLTLNPNGSPTRASMNITSSFILMSNSGITIDEARPYIQKGIELNRGNPKALSEFMARAKTYYPTL